jgi:hypothetical protein
LSAQFSDKRGLKCEVGVFGLHGFGRLPDEGFPDATSWLSAGTSDLNHRKGGGVCSTELDTRSFDHNRAGLFHRVSHGKDARHLKRQVTALEEALHRLTQQTAPRDYALLQTVPGIGEYLGLTLLYEIGDIQRFPTVKDFVSYCRLVKGTVASAGKIKGLRGAKLGNPYLRWAFGEAAVIAKRDHTVLGPLAQRLEARMNGNRVKGFASRGLTRRTKVFTRPATWHNTLYTAVSRSGFFAK